MKKNPIRFLLTYLLRAPWLLLGALLSALVQVAATLFLPIEIGHVVDAMVGQHQVKFPQVQTILPRIGLWILLAVMAQWLLNRWLNHLSAHVVQALRRDAEETIMQQDLLTLDQTPTGDRISRMVSDVDAVSDGLIQGVPQIFTGVLTIIGTVVLMFSLNHLLTWLVLAITPLSMSVASLIAGHAYQAFRQQSQLRAKQTALINETLQDPELLKTFALEQHQSGRYQVLNQSLDQVGRRAQFISSLTNPSTRLINNITYTLLGSLGAWQVVSGHLSVGLLSTMLAYAQQFMKPFNDISGVLAELQAALASAGRIEQLINQPKEHFSGQRALHKPISGELTLTQLAFGYRPNQLFMNDLSLRIKAGQKVAIVGPTGCGKTTLINLIMRFYPLTQGTIWLDGQNIQEVDVHHWRHAFGMVLQESWLFSGTIRDNIAYGKPDASDAEVEAAARKALIHDYIMQQEQGYQTVLNSSDQSMAYGQRQLLCLARVILMNPPVLILDEATSNIDTKTELDIQATMDALMHGRTSLVIAHRLKTIENADLIVFMEAGKIIEQGTHAQLMRRGGAYAKMHDAQFS